MHYEINVSIKGYHLFATSERSIDNESKAKVLAKIISEKFPKEYGYEVSLKMVQKVCHPVKY